MKNTVENTLCIIKPDAVRAQKEHEIMQLVELEGFHILEKRKIQLSPSHVKEFYVQHAGKPFFDQLLSFMTSGPVLALILARHDAVAAWRSLIGPTNSEIARETAPSTLRALYGTDGTKNAVHGSDSAASAQKEIKFFFPHREVGQLSEEPKPEIPKCLQEALCKGLTELAKQKPSQDPTAAIIWLGDWLLQHNPNKPLVYGPDELVLDNIDDGADFAPYISEVEETVRASEKTEESCQEDPLLHLQRTLAMIKPDAVAAGNAQSIMDKIEANGFKIVRRRYYRLFPAQAESFYAEHNGKTFFYDLIEFMTSGPIWALELEGEDSIKSWRTLMGPTNTATASQEAPTSLRAQFGTDGTRNATHGSDSVESAIREIEFHFPAMQSTLAMIKPDAVAAGNAENIIDQIEQQGFKIVQKRTYQLNEEQAKTFYAEHTDKPFFPRLLEFMTSGPIWALELEMHGAIAAWRAMMGPTSSTVAKEIAPMTLRAQFGTDGTMNAVHGSDSTHSAAREIAYHFQALPNAQPSSADQKSSEHENLSAAMPRIAINEKSEVEIAEAEAAAVKIQQAVRDRQTGQHEQHSQQQPVQWNNDASTHNTRQETAADEHAGDKNEAGEDVAHVREQAQADQIYSGVTDDPSTLLEQVDENGAVATADDAARSPRDGSSPDGETSVAAAEDSTIAEAEMDDAVLNSGTMTRYKGGAEISAGHE